LVPPAYGALQSGTESSIMRTECLLRGDSRTRLDVRLKFLQVAPETEPGSWQNAMERAVNLTDCDLEDLLPHARREEFHFPIDGDHRFIEGAVTVTARPLEAGFYQVAVHAVNRTVLKSPESLSRDQMLPYALAAAHT